jgi:hypothetical protein
MNPTFVKQFRCTLVVKTPKPRTCELISTDLNTLKDDINKLLGGGTKFEPAHTTTPNITVIYHPTLNSGETPLGWITSYDVPEQMSVGAIVEQTLAA